jgi:hypothetical protein
MKGLVLGVSWCIDGGNAVALYSGCGCMAV